MSPGPSTTFNPYLIIGVWPLLIAMAVGARVRRLLELEHKGLGVEIYECSCAEGGKRKPRIHIQITALTLPRTTPYLQVRPERGFDTLGKAFGSRDAQVESADLNDFHRRIPAHVWRGEPAR